MSLTLLMKDKKNERVLVVEDFEKNRNGIRCGCMTKNSSLTFKLKGSKNTLVMVTGYIAARSSLMANLELEEGRDGVDFDYIVKDMVPQIFDILEKYKLLEVKDGVVDMHCTIYFIQDGNIYEVISNGGVIEHPDFVADGEGEGLVIGSLYATRNNPDLMDRIRKAIKVACKYQMYNNYPFVVIDSKTLEYEVIDKEEC